MRLNKFLSGDHKKKKVWCFTLYCIRAAQAVYRSLYSVFKSCCFFLRGTYWTDVCFHIIKSFPPRIRVYIWNGNRCELCTWPWPRRFYTSLPSRSSQWDGWIGIGRSRSVRSVPEKTHQRSLDFRLTDSSANSKTCNRTNRWMDLNGSLNRVDSSH